MQFSDLDARIVTAVSLWLIGFIVTGFALKIWWTDPLARPFLLGPFFTKRGVQVIIRALPMLFLLGALAIAGGLGRFAYWLRNRGAMSDDVAAAAGILEAAISLWAAGAVVIFALRTWRLWREIR